MQDRPSNTGAHASRRTMRLEGLGFRANETELLSGIDLEIHAGAPTILMGPNGSGKTTLLRVMMGLIEPSEGRVIFACAADAAPVRRAIVFQKPVMLRRSAAANVAFALRAAGRTADAATIGALLDEAGLSALGHRAARKLSGGEQQRLALARALARAPEILFLDEPTASLDPAQTKAVEDIIQRVAAAGVKVVMATHDIGEARRLAGDVVFLSKGRLIEHSPAPQFFTDPATNDVRRFLAGELVF